MGAQIGRGRILIAAAAIALTVALGDRTLAQRPGNASSDGAPDSLSAAAEVGRRLFFDPSLSASGRMACGSCHDPRHAYAPANGLAVQLGGPSGTAAGTRAVPSLRYLEYTPPYADALDNPDGVSAPGPGGGFTDDGRAATLAEQASIPLLSENEMANRSAADVVAKVAASPYASDVRRVFGADVFRDPAAGFARIGEALQAFQREDVSFHPYSSKFDRYASNKIGGAMTLQELRGMAVFSDPARGNCAACHYPGAGLNGSVRLFTDFSFAAIGVPRNPEIPANSDASYFDLGICGRADHPRASSARFCGLFKTPTLRNVATRRVFFHNGRLKTLRDVIRFYNTRDTAPEAWYPTVDGVVQEFDDLPREYWGNLDTQAPLDGRPKGSRPAMSEQDMDDLEAFLRTLTDDDLLSPAGSALPARPAGVRALLLTPGASPF